MAVASKSFLQKATSAWESFFPTEKKSEDVKIKRGSSSGPQAFFPTNGSSRLLYAGSFNGEKNLGEMGPIKYYLMDYTALALRSWQMYIESAEAQTVINKFCTWVIGKGLKLQSEPIKELLSKYNKDLKKFSIDIEARWGVYANSKQADYSKRRTLNQLARIAFKNAILNGDVLCFLRYDENDCLTLQLIDTAHLMSPTMGSEWWPLIVKSGNRVINGVEIDEKGQHVAFYIRKPYDSLNPLNVLQWDRIPARGKKSGILQAFLVYGLEFRLDTQRGIPLLTVVLEKLKKLERYQEATLASAEEQAKIALQIVHELGSTGEFPWAKQTAAAFDTDARADLPANDLGEELANKVYATTNKQTINNTQGSKIEPLHESKAQLYFETFVDKNVDIICAALEIPPNVAMSKYDSNYSASRAAIKDWEHTLGVKRADFSIQFYQPIYNLFLETEIRRNEIQAPGYLTAQAQYDYITLEAYQSARFVGAPVANIDPMKEVQAERLKLGITAESIPLTTVEAATELLGGGDSGHNMEQYSDELEQSKKLGLKPEPEVKQSSVVTDK